MSVEVHSRAKPSFAWDAEKRFPLIFAGFVALSIFAHVAAFFIFQVTYPAQVTIPPPAAHVTVLSADIPEHHGLLAWVAAEDPALAGAISRAQPSGFAPLPYKASFEMVRTWPRRAPALYEEVPMPPGQSGFGFIQSATHPPAPKTAPAPPVTTRLEISGPLAQRTMSGTFSVDERSSTALIPSRFMVGVDAEGAVRHVFLQDSCGVGPMDEAAARSVKKLRFAPNVEAVTWGFMSIAWGDDVLIAEGGSNPPSQP